MPPRSPSLHVESPRLGGLGGLGSYKLRTIVGGYMDELTYSNCSFYETHTSADEFCSGGQIRPASSSPPSKNGRPI